MIPASSLLSSYGEKMEALGTLYRYLREHLEQRITELAYEASQTYPIASEWMPKPNFQFFSLDKSDGRHMRIVTAAGVLVILYNQPQGHITALFHFVNEEDVADSTHLFRFEHKDKELALVHISREQTTVLKRDEILDFLLQELLIPSITTERMKTALGVNEQRPAA